MNNREGYYIYGIIAAGRRQEYGPIGIGGRGDLVYTLPYRNVAAILSRAPIVKYAVTRDNMLTHTRVLECAVQEHTVLPVRFSTVAASEEVVVEQVLKTRYQEFINLAREMAGKLELGIRARWIDMEAIFAELADENTAIKALKEVAKREKNQQRRYATRIKIGQLVQSALEEKRKREKKELLEALRPLSLKWNELPIYGDMNLVSVAFLVCKEHEPAFEQKIAELKKVYEKRTQIKYIHSHIAYSFVELVINW